MPFGNLLRKHNTAVTLGLARCSKWLNIILHSIVLLNLGKRLFILVIVSNKESSSPESSISRDFDLRGKTLICFLCSLTSKAG